MKVRRSRESAEHYVAEGRQSIAEAFFHIQSFKTFIPFDSPFSGLTHFRAGGSVCAFERTKSVWSSLSERIFGLKLWLHVCMLIARAE